MSKTKTIITAAVTGSVHTPSMSPHLPVTPEEIADAALEAHDAGAAIVHLHVRDPETGEPTQNPRLFEPVLERISRQSDVIINLTTGGSPVMTIDERLAPVAEFKPELASLNMGSINFGLFPMLKRFTEFKHEWERSFLENSKDYISRNTFGDIARILEVGQSSGTRFEHECYDIGHLYNLAHFVADKQLEGPLLVQSVFGILGGIGTDPEDVAYMKRTADRLFGDRLLWSVIGGGRFQIPIATQALTLEGHVRVGLEDSLWLGRGQLAESSAQQVTKVRRLVEELGLEVATPDEGREQLGLKGRSEVGF